MQANTGSTEAGFVESDSQSIVALEGNGARPSHLGDGYSDDGVMYTLNTVEKHSVAYVIDHHPMDSREHLCEDGVTPTLHSRMGTGGGQRAVGCREVYMMTTGCQTQYTKDVAPTLMARDYKDAPLVCMEKY